MPNILPTATALQNAQTLNLGLYKHLRPFIFGNKALLHRYMQPAEKGAIDVGAYAWGLNTQYAWPGKTTGTIIDETFTKVWIENALLNYYSHASGSGPAIAPVSGIPNEIRASGLVLKTANGVNRSSTFGDRDVQIGDIVFLSGIVSMVQYSLWSTVTGLIADIVAASVGSATGDANNKTTQSATASIQQVSGTPINDISATVNGSAYNSLRDGYITRTYTITVTQGSVGGNATTALLSVVSADGLDNQTNVVPSAFGSPTAIGTKGMTVTWTDTPDSHSVSGIAPDDFVVGQQWTATVSQAFTAPTATSGGSYAGATNTTYVVRVTRGGHYTDPTPPQITISTSTGVDYSGPTNVTAASTFYAIGTQGTTIEFSQTALRAGDIYYVPVTAAAPGAVRTLVLQNNLPSQLSVATDLSVNLYIKVPYIQISQEQTVPSPVTNWTQDPVNGVTVNAGITQTTAGLTSGGSPVYVPVQSGNGWGLVYLEYREWDPTLAGQLLSFNTQASIPAVLGIIDPDNPVAYGVNAALANTATAVLAAPSGLAPLNTDICYASVLSDQPLDYTAWQSAMNVAVGQDAYNFVPMSSDPEVYSLTVAFVRAQSTPTTQGNCACFLQGFVTNPLPIVTSATTSDGQVALATIAFDSVTGAYTLLTVPANDSDFVTNKVMAGDTVRYQYGVDAFGNTTYVTYIVASILSEGSLRLVSGPSGAVSTPQRVEVWRNLTTAQMVTQLTTAAASYAGGDGRVCYCWPDAATVNGVAVSGAYVCAALAGLAGSVASHQGLRNVQFLGFTSLPRTNIFTSAQLQSLKTGGVWVSATDIATGFNYVQAAVTTDTSAPAVIEEMYRRNQDMFYLDVVRDVWGQFIGSSNVTSSVAALMRSVFNAWVNQVQQTTYTASLGAAIVSATISSLAPSTTAPDQMVATVAYVGPYPDNQNNLTIVI